MKRVLAGAALLFIAGMAIGDGEALFKEGASRFATDPDQALPLFLQAAGEGHVQAMVGAAHCFENGIGTKTDFAQAVAWYEKAVGQNSITACEALARIYASCIDPPFHDGAKAVKYATAVVRKEPKDPDALLLLAAAHARNADFERAGLTVKKMLSRETRAAEIARLEQLQERYGQGIPSPAVATEQWIIDAANKGSLWAMEHAIRKLSDPNDPRYNLEGALALCRTGVEDGHSSLNIQMIGLCVDIGDLDKAYKSYQVIQEAMRGKRWTGPAPVEVRFGYSVRGGDARRLFEDAEKYREHRSSWVVSGKYDEVRLNSRGVYVVENGDVDFYESFDSEEDLKSSFPTWDSGEQDITGMVGNRRCRLEVRIEQNPPDMQACFFLLKVAAARGNENARSKRDALIEEMGRYRKVLESVGGSDTNHEVASALRAEALRFCSNDDLPANLPLAEELFMKAYVIDPSPRTACMLGMLYLRDYFSYGFYKTRSPDIAEHWLRVAHSSGYDPAARRLIELYACDEDPTARNRERALEVAQALVKQHPDDHDALQLLACAYAVNSRFMDAKNYMANAVESCPSTDKGLRQEYARKARNFGKSEAFTMRRINASYEKRTFAEWIEALPD